MTAYSKSCPERTLRSHDLTGRGSGEGGSGNASMESFFALLQKNILDRHRWATRAQLRPAIIAWI